MSAYSGTWTLIRFILRRDRVRIPIWIIAILVTVVGTAATLPDTYPTAADRESRATLVENPAMRILFGPAVGLDDYTFGAMMATEMLGIMTIVVALMSIFMVTRHTRAEEESGRAELTRSSVVGQRAGMTAVLTVTIGLNLVIALLVGLSLDATLAELDLAGSMLFGAAMAATGITFAAISAVSVQINEFSRAANGMSIAVLGVTYVVRGFGDMLENALAWTPPFGLVLQTEPYVIDRWWPLVLTGAIAAVLIPVAFSLSTRRDMAAGLRPPRPGLAHASRALTAPFGLTLRLQRGSLIAWTAGLVLFGTLYGGILSEVGEMYATNPLVEDYFATLGLDLAEIADSIIAMIVMFLGLLATVFTVSTVTRLRTEETSLRAENVLATAVSRVRWAGQALVFGLVTSTAILLLTGLGAGITYAFESGNASNVWIVVGATSAYAPVLWIAAAVAVAVFGLIPRLMFLAWFVPVYGLVAFMLGPLLGLPGWANNLSPLEYIPRVPSEEFEILPLAVITLVSLALMVAGLIGVRRRDLDFV